MKKLGGSVSASHARDTSAAHERPASAWPDPAGHETNQQTDYTGL